MPSTTTNLTTLLTVLRAARAAGVACCLWSDPGMGKSSLVQALAAADGVACETVIGSLREPSDFAGLPVITDGGVVLSAPSWARRLMAAEGGGYLFLDELTTSAPAVLLCLSQARGLQSQEPLLLGLDLACRRRVVVDEGSSSQVPRL